MKFARIILRNQSSDHRGGFIGTIKETPALCGTGCREPHGMFQEERAERGTGVMMACC